MNRDCEKGPHLRLQFEHTLKESGWFDAYERALELMPVSLLRVHDFQREARHAHAELIKARYVYVEYMAECVACSGRLIIPEAIAMIRDKLHKL